LDARICIHICETLGEFERRVAEAQQSKEKQGNPTAVET
jgi:hypothetical protein